MNNLKCQNCGADITTQAAQKTGKCEYCNSRFAPKKQEEKPVLQNTEEPTEYFNSDLFESRDDKRPRIRIVPLLFFMMIGPVFFIGYIILTEMRKKDWDKRHPIN